MGDFNSKIGKRQNDENLIVGPYGYGGRNERGWELLRFSERNNLKIINTFLKKRNGRKRTWISPNAEHKNEIDFFLAKHNKYFKEVNISNLKFSTDHRILTATIMIEGI